MKTSTISPLIFGAHSADSLAERFGTPLYVYREEKIRTAYELLLKMVKYRPLDIHYAVMANNRPPVLQVLAELGAFAQVNSQKKLSECLDSGFGVKRINLTTTNLSRLDIESYVKLGIFLNLDSLEELEKFGQITQSLRINAPKCGLRLQINQSVGDQATNQRIGKNRVGIESSQLPQALQIARKFKVRLTCLHGYLASNLLDVKPFLELTTQLTISAKQLPDLEILNIGGGFGIPVRPQDQPFDFQTLGAHLTSLLNELSNYYGRTITLKIEPGRFLVGPSGTLLTRVTNLKKHSEWTEVGCDAGFGVFARPFIYGQEAGYHPVVLAQNPKGKPTHRYTICANSVLQNDIIAEDRDLPELLEGDILAIQSVGAYGAVMASGFPGKRLAREVWITKNGQITEILPK